MICYVINISVIRKTWKGKKILTNLSRSDILDSPQLPCSEKAMAPHSSTLAWKIPWTEEPGRLQSMGSLRVRYIWATSLSLFTFLHWRRKWQPTPVFFPGESQGWGSLVGFCLWGRTELDTTVRLNSNNNKTLLKIVDGFIYFTHKFKWLLPKVPSWFCYAMLSHFSRVWLWDSPGKNTGVGCHSFSNAWKWKVKVKSLSCVWLLETPRTAAHQAHLSMGFSKQEYWSGVPLPSLSWF